MNSEYSLDKNTENEIISFAEKCGINKVILFGSRARGDNRERSDIDIAVSGGDVAEFSCGIDDEINTLLMFDVVDLDSTLNKALLEDIEREGVLIYEKKI